MIQLGEVTCVVASRSDRINRNQLEQNYFYALCVRHGVEWVFTDEPEASSNSPWGEEIRREKAYEAERESYKIGRRQERAYHFAEQQGRTTCRRVHLGYRINKQRKFEIDSLMSDSSNAVAKDNQGNLFAAGELARLLIDNYLKYGTLRLALKNWKFYLQTLEFLNVKVKDRLTKLSVGTVSDWIKDPTLRGHTAYGRYQKESYGDKLQKKRYKKLNSEEWRIQYHTHPDQVLITETEWQFIKKQVEVNANKGRAIAQSRMSPEEPKSLSSILRCKKCGLFFVRSSSVQKGKKYVYYYCQGKADFHCKNKGISQKILKAQLIDKIVLQARTLVSMIEKAKADFVESSPEKIKLLEQEISDAKTKYEVLKFDAFLSLARTLEQQLNALLTNRKKEIIQLESRKSLLIDLAEKDYWLSLDQLNLHRYLRCLVKDAWIEDGHLISVDLDV